MESVLVWPDTVVVCVADTAQARTCAIRTLVHVALRQGEVGSAPLLLAHTLPLPVAGFGSGRGSEAGSSVSHRLLMVAIPLALHSTVCVPSVFPAAPCWAWAVPCYR